MLTMTTVEARDHFSELLNRTAYGKERIILTRRGQHLVAVVPLEDLQLLEQLKNCTDPKNAPATVAEPAFTG